MFRRLGLGFATLAVAGSACSRPEAALVVPPALEIQESGTKALLQAVAVVNARTIWLSGHDGVVLKTEDGGRAWTRVPTPAGDSLQFRDIYASSARAAVILSAGTGAASRIYRTADAGGTWELAYLMEDAAGFLDCLDFWDERGFAYGDAIDGAPFILLTRDGGRSWTRAEADSLPPAISGEGGFAASGTCARAGEAGRGWIATGASGAARVLRTTDYGATWQAADVPVVRGDAAGLTTVSFQRDGRHGFAFGGDLSNMDGRTDNAAISSDSGVTWALQPPPPLLGPVYGSAVVPEASGVFVVGPAGAQYSPDGGGGWVTVDTASYWAVGSAGAGATWLVGPQGRIVRVEVP